MCRSLRSIAGLQSHDWPGGYGIEARAMPGDGTTGFRIARSCPVLGWSDAVLDNGYPHSILDWVGSRDFLWIGEPLDEAAD
ncbi:hypothetical protein AA0229_1183 [Gluconobacter cerinus NRIC 0229]|nr:hypothetical protein AA0229_1183 [Gluconobacter cerinus NRIC 0229]